MFLMADVDREGAPSTLRILSAACAALLANLLWILSLAVTCGEPPYPRTFCNDHGAPFAPWYLLILVGPALVLLGAIVARKFQQPIVFEMVWIVSVCIGFAALLMPVAD